MMKRMKMNGRTARTAAAVLLLCAVCACEPRTRGEEPEPQPQGGYADPAGVFVLNEGSFSENGSVSYLAPDGSAEQDLYRKINESELGNYAQDMYLYGGKYYILCRNDYTVGKTTGDGRLIVVDAETFRKEKVFEAELESLKSMTNLAVLDESNIFINDESGMYRFDSLTGRLTIVEGTYRVAFDDGSTAGKVSSLGMAVVDGRLYASAGGWEMATEDARYGIYEFEKGCDSVVRRLGVTNRSRISGVTPVENGCIWVAATVYADEISGITSGQNEIFKVDCRTMTVLGSQPVRKGTLDAGFFRTSAVAACGNDLYFTGNTTQIYRHSFVSGRTELLLDVASLDADAQCIYNNITADPIGKRLYLCTLKGKSEAEYRENNVFVFDISEAGTPELLYNHRGLTRYPAGIYPVSCFR